MTQQELEQKIIDIETMTREDHEILQSVHRTQRIQSYTKIFYWAIVILGFFGAFYWVYPYVDQIKTSYQNLVNQVDTTKKTIKDFQTKKDALQKDVNGILKKVEEVKKATQTQ